MKKLALLFILLLITGCNEVKPNKFEELGYSKKEIAIIEKLKNPDIIKSYDKEIIEIIKNKDFKEENINNYLDLKNKYKFSIDDIIFIGNKFYDKNINYDENILSLMHEKYFILDNLDRYLEYQKIKDLDNYNIILEVNSNLDHTFYIDTTETDLSKGYLILVNKYNYLKQDYVPDNMVYIESGLGITSGQLEKTVYEAYKNMWNDAKKEGLTLYINSPYRSYNVQYSLYHNYGKRDGYALADTYSARPGFSEHQTGLAFDVTSLSTNFDTFAYSNEYEWLQENAYKYGFILRYPKGKEYITGYQYESWHYRYVGVEAATYIKENNLTFEEYYAYFVK